MTGKTPPRILLIGHRGQTAIELQGLLDQQASIVTAGRSGKPQQHCDLADPDSIESALDKVRPDWVINAAAWNQVDLAEQEREMAMQVNGHAPAQIAAWCAAHGATCIHYSTDYVFDGKASTPYVETDAVNPISAYGESKLAGEQTVLASGCHGAVLRTSWVYSLHGSNFLNVMRKLLASRDELSIVNDQIGVPTWARTLAELTVRLLHSEGAHEEMQLYHACNSGVTSRHGQVAAIREQLVAQGVDGLAALRSIPSSEFPQAAARPQYSVMDNHKLATRLNWAIPDWLAAQRACLDELGEGVIEI